MKILKQEDEKTRIIQQRSLWFLGITIRRQRKIGWRWKTVAWLYTNQCDTIEKYAENFDYQERNNIGIRNQF